MDCDGSMEQIKLENTVSHLHRLRHRRQIEHKAHEAWEMITGNKNDVKMKIMPDLVRDYQLSQFNFASLNLL